MQPNKPKFRFLLLVENITMLKDKEGNQKLGIVEPLPNIIISKDRTRFRCKTIYCISNLEIGKTYLSKLEFYAPSGRQVMMLEDKLLAEDDNGFPPVLTVIADLNAILDEPGEYTLRLNFDGKFIGEQALVVAFLEDMGQ